MACIEQPHKLFVIGSSSAVTDGGEDGQYNRGGSCTGW